MTTPTADDLALAREIFLEERRGFLSPDEQIDRIASLIAKHRQPPPQRDAWYVPDLTRAWLEKHQPELVPHAEWINGQMQAAFDKGKQIGEGNASQPPPAMTIEEQMAEIDEKFASTPGIKFQPLKKLFTAKAPKGQTP